jgi:hypothetical protein
MRSAWVVLVALCLASISYAESDTVNGTYREMIDLKFMKSDCRGNTYQCADTLEQFAAMYPQLASKYGHIDGTDEIRKIIEEGTKRLNVTDSKSLKKICRKNYDECGALLYYHIDLATIYMDKYGTKEDKDAMTKMIEDSWGRFAPPAAMKAF